MRLDRYYFYPHYALQDKPVKIVEIVSCDNEEFLVKADNELELYARKEELFEEKNEDFYLALMANKINNFKLSATDLVWLKQWIKNETR